MSSPPPSPIRRRIPHIEASPTQPQPISRRSSSAYSNPRSSYSDRRLSNYSNGTNDLGTPIDGGGHLPSSGNAGNLADELEFADEDGEWDEEDGLEQAVSAMSLGDEMAQTPRDTGRYDTSTNSSPSHRERHLHVLAPLDDTRDSGVDVADPAASPSSTCRKSPSGPAHRNFSRPISRDSEVSSPDVFTLEMEDAMAAIARLAEPTVHDQADTIARTLSALQHLGPQSTLETQTQRFTTSTNSLASHIIQQTRLLGSLSASLFSPFGLSAPLDPFVVDEVIPQMQEVLQTLPQPDPSAPQSLSKLDRETTDLLRTLSSLADSLQMGRQTTSSAARVLRNTQTIVTQLRREADIAEQAKWKIEKEGWDRRLAERWYAGECKNVVGGFEQVCEGLRRGLEEKTAA